MEFWKPESSLKTEQSTAMRFHVNKAQTFVKILEISSALILIFWSTTRLPVALNLLIDFSKQTFALLLTTPSVFIIGNAIVVTLVAQFQSLTASNSDYYDEFVAETRNRNAIPIPIPTQSVQKAEKIEPLPIPDSSSSSSEPAGAESEVIRCCRRTQSERVLSVRCNEMIKKELRRTRTECREMKKVKTTAFEVVHELSGDEFRRRVESFIAKQQRFIRDENLSPSDH